MTHFFDLMTDDKIDELKVAPNDIVYVGLKITNIRDFGLNVTSFDGIRAYTDGDAAVRRLRNMAEDEELYEITGSGTKSTVLRACARDPRLTTMDPFLLSNSSFELKPPQAQIRLSPEKNFSGNSPARRGIVHLARSFVHRAHYLWGTAGNRPGASDGNHTHARAASIRPVCLDASATGPWPGSTLNDRVLGINQAAQASFDFYNSCAGRSGRTGIEAKVPDAEILAYVKDRAEALKRGETNTRLWTGLGPRKNLYPRRFWKSFHPEANKVDGQLTGIVCGESCHDVPHFDCVGLVNYCYSRFWKKPPLENSIEGYMSPNSGTLEVTSDKTRPFMDADIVVPNKGGHIAMIYQDGDRWKVVQAEETIKGLTDTAEFVPADWKRFRMDAAFLRDV